MKYFYKIEIVLLLSLLLSGCNNNIVDEKNNKSNIQQENIIQEKADHTDLTQINDEEFETVSDKNSQALISFEQIKNIQKKYEDILDMIHIRDYVIVVHKNFNYTIYDLRSHKSMMIEDVRLLTEKEIYVDDNQLSISLGNRIKIFSLRELELLVDKEYEETIDSVQISPDMQNIVYLNKNNELYYSDIDNSKPQLIKLEKNYKDSAKLLLPRFLDENTILVELIGPYPDGTNLIKYNIKTNTQEILHVDDRVVGHTSYLSNSLDTSVLSSEFICYIIDMTSFQVIDTLELSEQKNFIPEFNHAKNKLLYINDNNKIAVYDLNTGNKTIIEEWSGEYLSWLFDDNSIFGNQIINNENNFFFYSLAK